jgi:hypothetical protein
VPESGQQRSRLQSWMLLLDACGASTSTTFQHPDRSSRPLGQTPITPSDSKAYVADHQQPTPAFEADNGRSALAAGTALHAPYLPFADPIRSGTTSMLLGIGLPLPVASTLPRRVLELASKNDPWLRSAIAFLRPPMPIWVASARPALWPTDCADLRPLWLKHSSWRRVDARDVSVPSTASFESFCPRRR